MFDYAAMCDREGSIARAPRPHVVCPRIEKQRKSDELKETRTEILRARAREVCDVPFQKIAQKRKHEGHHRFDSWRKKSLRQF